MTQVAKYLLLFDRSNFNVVLSARTFLFYSSHSLDWTPLLLQWSPRYSMYDALGSALTAIALVDVAVDRLQELQSYAPASTLGTLPISHLENFLNVAAFRGDAIKPASSIGHDAVIGDTNEDDSDMQHGAAKSSVATAKSRGWGRVTVAVKKTKNVKQIPHDCGIYALSCSFRTPSLDDPGVTMALSDRAILMELTSGLKHLCGLTRRPCVTVACPTQHIWQKCQPVLVMNVGLGSLWGIKGSMGVCSNVIRDCSVGRCCTRSMEWMLWVVGTLSDRPSSDMLLRLCASQLLSSSSLSSLLSWCFSASVSRFNFDANRTGSSSCVLVSGSVAFESKNRGSTLIKGGCGCSICCRVFAISVITELFSGGKNTSGGGSGGLGLLLQDEMRKCGLLPVIDDAVSSQQYLEHDSLMQCRSCCGTKASGTSDSLSSMQRRPSIVSGDEAVDAQTNLSGSRLIATSLMILMSKLFSNTAILDVVNTADTSGSSLIVNLLMLLRSAWTHEIAECMMTWASDSVRGIISIAITDRPSYLLEFSKLAPFEATACDIITQSPFSLHKYAMEEQRPFLFSMPWQKGSACLALQALMEVFRVTSYAQTGCFLLPSMVGQVFQPCMQLLACVIRSSVSSRKSNLAHWDSCRLMLVALRQFCGCCNTLLLDCMWRRRCLWMHNLHHHVASGLRDLVSVRRCLSNAIESTPDAAFKTKLTNILDLVLAVCSAASLTLSHILLDEHASVEIAIVDVKSCEYLWMLSVLLENAQGTVAARLQYQSCAAVLTCCLLASHPHAITSLQDPKYRLGLSFVPEELKRQQHSPVWYPSSDGSCKRQLVTVLASAQSAFDFDNEFASIMPAKMAVTCVLRLLEGEDNGMIQRALNALQVSFCKTIEFTCLNHPFIRRGHSDPFHRACILFMTR
jgi:hypothetical protein